MAWNILKSSKKQEAKKIKDLELTNKVIEGNQTFMTSAHDTIQLAVDVTAGLKEKVVEYSSQIKKISEMLTDGLILADVTGTIQSANSATYDIFGYKDPELVGKNISNIFDITKFDININSDFMVKLNELISKKNPQPYEVFKGLKENKDSIYIDVSMSSALRSDKSEYYIVIIRDITERVVSEQELKQLIDNNIDMVCYCDTNFKITFVNTQFKNNFSKDCGDSVLSIFTKNKRKHVRDDLNSLTDSDQVLRRLYKFEKEHHEEYQDWYIKSMFDDDGEKIGYQISSRNITDYFNQ